MILLQVVKAGGKLHNTAALETFRKAFSEGRRYQSAWISHEEQLRVRRLCQRAMRLLYGRIHICLSIVLGHPLTFAVHEAKAELGIRRTLFRQLAKPRHGLRI